jgi:DNA-binding NarL/FixJ family response regulator
VTTLLVVDDDDDYRFLLRSALGGGAGVSVVAEASSADEARTAMSRSDGDDPEMVLLDASLPGAVALATDLRSWHPAIRIVLTSSLPASHVADTVVRAGAVGSLAKDIPLTRLADAIGQLGDLVGVAERTLRTEQTTLPGIPASARTSRRVLLAALEGWGTADVRDKAALLISELVTNVVRHAATDVDLRIAMGAGTVRVEVGDRNPEVPVMRTPAPTDLGGRGMRIVDDLALRWGMEARRTGKCVWFELSREPAVSPT